MSALSVYRPWIVCALSLASQTVSCLTHSHTTPSAIAHPHTASSTLRSACPHGLPVYSPVVPKDLGRDLAFWGRTSGESGDRRP